MLISSIRTVILLTALTVAVRLMGKRQIGQLQPSELVVTIVISEIAVVPMQDNDIPMINTLIELCLIVGFEIILAAIGVKSEKFRTVLEGNPVIVIKDGVILQKNMKALRFTIDDLFEALRQNGVFDVADVQYAFAETNGMLSVMLKPEKQPLDNGSAGKTPADKGLPDIIVADGRVIKKTLTEKNISDKQISHIIRKAGLELEDVFLLTVDKKGNINLVERDKDLG